MSTVATALPTYVWHYVVARLLYDDLVRPLSHSGRLGTVLVALACALVAYRLGRTRASGRGRVPGWRSASERRRD